MARGAYPRGLIQRLAEADTSPTAALRDFREAGGKIATQTWYRMWGEIENEKSLEGIEWGAPLHLKPTQSEILPMTTKRASGYMQRVQVFGRTANGEVMTKTIDVRSGSLISRKNAIGRAQGIVEGIDTGGRATDSVPVAVVGAVYGGTFELTPA